MAQLLAGLGGVLDEATGEYEPEPAEMAQWKAHEAAQEARIRATAQAFYQDRAEPAASPVPAAPQQAPKPEPAPQTDPPPYKRDRSGHSMG